MTSALFSLSMGLNNLFIILTVFILIGLGIGLNVYFQRCVGTGHRLGPTRLWKKYGKVAIPLLVIAIGYANLDHYCEFQIKTDQSSYGAGEAVEINCTVKNPLPVPIYYRGHSAIVTEMRYIDGSKVQRAHLTIREATAEAASEAARAASGAIIENGFIAPYREKVVKTVIYVPKYEGEVIVNAELWSIAKVSTSHLGISITEYEPIWVTVNSTGVTLLLEPSEDPDNPTILIRVKNDNPYPVRIPTFSPLEIKHGSLDSEIYYMIFINWVYPHWDIPAYSTKTIYNTDAYASDTRTPIYYTLYGQTLRYPPE